MGKLTIDLPELISRRLAALAYAKGATVEALAIQCVEEFAAAPSTRQAILKARGLLLSASPRFWKLFDRAAKSKAWTALEDL